jgi:hypothetical protein
MFRQLAEARKAGDEAEALRIVERVRREGTRSQVRVFEQSLSTIDDIAFREAIGQPPGTYSLGAAVSGERLCDFCGDPGPACFFPVDEFHVTATDPDSRRTVTFPSGDRFYACATCAPMIEAADWKALREYCGPGVQQASIRVLWAGFARNRSGPPVPVDAAGDPLPPAPRT